jgi:hypothetical protein
MKKNLFKDVNDIIQECVILQIAHVKRKIQIIS